MSKRITTDSRSMKMSWGFDGSATFETSTDTTISSILYGCCVCVMKMTTTEFTAKRIDGQDCIVVSAQPIIVDVVSE